MFDLNLFLFNLACYEYSNHFLYIYIFVTVEVNMDIRICMTYSHVHLGRVKRIWYLSPMRAVKVQASLRIHAVSPEPPLLAHTNSESRGTFRQKATSLAPAGHAQLKFVMTECSKTHIRLTRLILYSQYLARVMVWIHNG